MFAEFFHVLSAWLAFQALKGGVTLHLRNAESSLQFTVQPVRLFGTGPVMAYSFFRNGRLDRSHKGKMLSDSVVLDMVLHAQIEGTEP